jgi:hypothetical protein
LPGTCSMSSQAIQLIAVMESNSAIISAYSLNLINSIG